MYSIEIQIFYHLHSSPSVHAELKELPGRAPTSLRVPWGLWSRPCPRPLQEALQDQQVGLASALIELLLLPWVPECGASGHPSSMGPYFLQPHDFLESKLCWLQRQTVWRLNPQCGNLGAEEPSVRSGPWSEGDPL